MRDIRSDFHLDIPEAKVVKDNFGLRGREKSLTIVISEQDVANNLVA